MIRILCNFLVLACVAGLSGVLTGHLWNHYADQHGLSRVGAIYQRILPVRATAAPRDRLTQQTSAPEE